MEARHFVSELICLVLSSGIVVMGSGIGQWMALHIERRTRAQKRHQRRRHLKVRVERPGREIQIPASELMRDVEIR